MDLRILCRQNVVRSVSELELDTPPFGSVTNDSYKLIQFSESNTYSIYDARMNDSYESTLYGESKAHRSLTRSCYRINQIYI